MTEVADTEVAKISESKTVQTAIAKHAPFFWGLPDHVLADPRKMLPR
jgi:hypothetical protein